MSGETITLMLTREQVARLLAGLRLVEDRASEGLLEFIGRLEDLHAEKGR